MAVVGWLHVTQATTRGCRAQLLAAYGVLLLVTLWPLGDLAARVSLTGATVQRLLIMLLVAPLLLLGTPIELFARLPRPAVVDEVVRHANFERLGLKVKGIL